MSKSNKSRYGMRTKHWKDSIREARSKLGASVRRLRHALGVDVKTS